MTLSLLIGAVLLGAATQRITGMGFALMASPFLIVALGVDNGVAMSQVLTLTASVLVGSQMWKDIEWRRVAILIPAAGVGIVPGLWLTRQLSTAVLSIVIGSMVIVALITVTASERARVFTGTTGCAAAGGLSGFMNVTAGVGGPPIVLYRLSTGWPHAAYVATVQVYFIGLNTASLLTRGTPDLDAPTWVASVGALAGGLVIGTRLDRHVSDQQARRLIIVVALTGAVATVVKGFTSL